MKDHISQHLTVVDKTINDLQAKTPPGMAHWSGTGPAMTTCRECVSYQFGGYKSKKGGITGGTLKLGSCKEYARLTNVDGPKIPHETQSCKYYKENKTPPAVTDPRKD